MVQGPMGQCRSNSSLRFIISIIPIDIDLSYAQLWRESCEGTVLGTTETLRTQSCYTRITLSKDIPSAKAELLRMQTSCVCIALA